MKFNLKNKPFCKGVNCDLRCYDWEKWFEGFEKELRKKIKNLKPQKQYYDFEVARILEEILGETE